MGRSSALAALGLVLVWQVLVTHAAHARQNAGDRPATVKRATVVRTGTPIQLDGLLNEDAWTKSSSIGEILQREPREDVPASEDTEVRLLFDESNLYIGVLCRDSDSDGIIATQMSRDADLSVDDRIEIKRFEESRLAESRPVDSASRPRSLFRRQPWMDSRSGCGRRNAFPDIRPGRCGQGAVHTTVLRRYL